MRWKLSFGWLECKQYGWLNNANVMMELLFALVDMEKKSNCISEIEI